MATTVIVQGGGGASTSAGLREEVRPASASGLLDVDTGRRSAGVQRSANARHSFTDASEATNTARTQNGPLRKTPVDYYRHRDGTATTAQQSANEAAGQQPMPWFHGHISRADTELQLKDKKNGTFLIRESTNYPGDYTLCLAFQNATEHYRIYSKDGFLTCDDEEKFEHLTQLVAHYKLDADGLCHRLVTPLLAPQYLRQINAPDIGRTTVAFEKAGWTIARQQLLLQDCIGCGEFGDVLLGRYVGTRVAVKRLKYASGAADSLLEEASLMTSLRHINLVELIGVVLDDINDLFIVTEYMANGNLVDYLRSRGRHAVDKRQLVLFARDICRGMSYVEQERVVHRDLAARNVLLSESMTAKISDFGLAKKDNSCPTPKCDSSGKFPIKWTAPEALRYSQFSSKSDMWSYGIVLWEIWSFGRVPYPRIPIQDVIRHIEKGYRMEAPEGCPKEIDVLMKEAWTLLPENRPTFAKMLISLENYLSSTDSERMTLLPTPPPPPPPPPSHMPRSVP